MQYNRSPSIRYLGHLRIAEFLPHYWIVENGKVVSTYRSRAYRLLTPRLNTHGYQQVYIHKQNHLVHRLVASAFLPNPNNLPEVDHIDRNKTNNRIDNLRWVTTQENAEAWRNHEKSLRSNRRGNVGRL